MAEEITKLERSREVPSEAVDDSARKNLEDAVARLKDRARQLLAAAKDAIQNPDDISSTKMPSGFVSFRCISPERVRRDRSALRGGHCQHEAGVITCRPGALRPPSLPFRSPALLLLTISSSAGTRFRANDAGGIGHDRSGRCRCQPAQRPLQVVVSIRQPQQTRFRPSSMLEFLCV
jgi:hypothetical protein